MEPDTASFHAPGSHRNLCVTYRAGGSGCFGCGYGSGPFARAGGFGGYGSGPFARTGGFGGYGSGPFARTGGFGGYGSGPFANQRALLLCAATTVFRPIAPVKINRAASNAASPRDIVCLQGSTTPEAQYTCLRLRQIDYTLGLFCIGIHLPAPYFRSAFAKRPRRGIPDRSEVKF